MSELDTDRILSDYIDRNPAARAAHVNDPAFQMQMESLSRILDLLVPALRHEGLDPMQARRVVNTLVYGVPDPEGAIMRMAESEVAVRKLMAEPISFHLGEETAKALREGTWKTTNPLGGTVLTSADPEPPVGTLVRDDCGVEWVNDGHRPCCWVRHDLVEQGIHDPEPWTKIAGNYGPVTVVRAPAVKR